MTLSPDEIKNLKVGQLRFELEARNLPTDGLKNVLALRLMQHCFKEVQNQQQLAASSSGSPPLTDQDMMASTTTRKTSGTKRRNAGGDLLKRVKKSLESSLLEYVCPISRELPLDPVIAMDGQIYERSEIMMWIGFKKSKSESVTSPLTNKKMGKTLIDAPRVYNAIEKLIVEDEINSDLAKSWLQRVKDRKADKRDVSALLAEANSGDGKAMYNLALWYESGEKGLPMDLDQAIQWYKKSSDSNYPPGMSAYGSYLVCPEGKIKKNIQYGTFLVARAASEGSSHACYTVGEWYRDGEHGFPKDIEQTRRYFCLVAHEYCEHDDMDDEHVEEVQKWLDDNE